MTKMPAPKSVLFVCNQNAIRSPIAAAYLKKIAKGRVFVGSAGLISGLADGFTKAILDEKDIPLGDHEPQSLNALNPVDFDLVVALTNKSKDRLQDDGVDAKTQLEFWDIVDPTQIKGHRDQILQSYRIVRDALEERVSKRFGYLIA